MGITPLTNKCHIYKAFESFASPNGNILATIKYSQKIKSYQTSSPIALLLFFVFFFCVFFFDFFKFC